MKRRVYLAGATATATVLAGCGAFASEEDDDGDDEGETTSDPAVQEFDQFDDLEVWETVVGSATADTDRVAVGDQSVLLEADESSSARIRRELEEPFDATGLNPGLAVTADVRTSPTVQLIDEDGDWLEFRQRIPPDLPINRVGFGLADVEGAPDPSAIVEIHVSLWVGEDASGQLWADDLHFVPRPEDGVVTLQFAGGHEEVHSLGLPAVEERDLTATAFVPPARLRESEDEEGPRMTVEQVADLADSGWTIASQSNRDQLMTGLEPDEQEADIVDAIEWLEDNGYGAGARSFSYPGDRYDESSLELVAEHHDVGYAGEYPVQAYAVAPERFGRVMNPDPAAAEVALERTAEYGGITALTFYAPEDESALTATLDALADHVEEGSIETVSSTQIADEYVI